MSGPVVVMTVDYPGLKARVRVAHLRVEDDRVLMRTARFGGMPGIGSGVMRAAVGLEDQPPALVVDVVPVGELATDRVLWDGYVVERRQGPAVAG